jgi:hypothetical protein
MANKRSAKRGSTIIAVVAVVAAIAAAPSAALAGSGKGSGGSGKVTGHGSVHTEASWVEE